VKAKLAHRKRGKIKKIAQITKFINENRIDKAERTELKTMPNH